MGKCWSSGKNIQICHVISIYLFREKVYRFHKVETKLGRWVTKEDESQNLDFSRKY